ncbi:High potential iron-sulfur protein [Luminiphilus syltensis NOR5-1B]|uniref:High-potential iron-sulfur protein n=1 Tax=Luminiphilus syltensis NOR5-1B TaxID=565045 RepID=B8KSX6_9GAMM|nr:high-potential iron-sulfur protein [Luminiphilus syltensis]EED35779.1 High potential iron-sulfur protein [Luminiphilus syltensis NOR5-1B]
MKPCGMTRRQLIAGSAALCLPIPDSGFAQGVLDPQSLSAQALGYSPDHTQVDTKAWPKKASANGDKQRCRSCALFKKGESEVGRCDIFWGREVPDNGWCNAWTKR